MNNNKTFYKCEICGNLVGMIDNKGPKLSCCGKVMDELVANSTEAATEKHIPVVNIDNNIVKVEVGSVTHPMTEEHHIGWIYLLTNKGVQHKNLDVTGSPVATFELGEDEKVLEVYEYCNLHGLWKVEMN